MRSLLYFLGARRTALLTHSLVEMTSEAGKRIPGLLNLLDDARKLDLHYIPSRYPNGLPSGYPHRFYARQMAEEAVNAGDRILTGVEANYRELNEEGIIPEDG